jgi:hypothetical protein
MGSSEFTVLNRVVLRRAVLISGLRSRCQTGCSRHSRPRSLCLVTCFLPDQGSLCGN